MPPSRDLKVRFVGDAGNLKQTFQEVSAGAQASSVGLKSADSSANTVGRTFVRTGRIAKSTGKALKSTGLDAAASSVAFISGAPKVGVFAGALGTATIAAESLGEGLKSLGVTAQAVPVILAATILVAAAAGAAYVLLRDRVSASTRAMELQKEANEEVAASHRATADAVNAHQDALASLRGAALSNEEAVLGVLRANERLAELNKEGGKSSIAYRDALLDLEKANQKVATAETDHGRSSLDYRQALIAREEATKKVAEAEEAGGKKTLEYREALLAQKRAQEALVASRVDLIRKGEETIDQTHKSTKAIDDEVKATRKAADAARERDQMIRLGIISGKDTAGAAKEIKRALDAESKASAQSAAKHRDNAQRATEMANAIGGATPKAKALRDRLVELANTELSMAAQIAAIRAVGSAAASAQAGVNALVAALTRASSAPSPSAAGGGGGGGGKGKGGGGGGGGGRQTKDEVGQRSDALVRLIAGGNLLSPTDRANLTIEDLHRDDSLQEKRIRAGVTAKSAKAGITNPDEIALRQERAVAEARKKEIQRDMGAVRKAVGKVKTLIANRKRKRAVSYKNLRAVRGSDDKTKAKRDAINTAIAGHSSAIRDRYDELNALIRQGADLQAEAAELGFDITALNVEIAATPDVVPPDEAPEAAEAAVGTDATASAIAEQQAALAEVNRRRGDLSEAALRTFTGPGDIGSGGATFVQNNYMYAPDDPQVLRKLADSAARGFGLQGGVASPVFPSGA